MGSRQERGTQGHAGAEECEQATWPELPRGTPTFGICGVWFLFMPWREQCHRFPELGSLASPSPDPACHPITVPQFTGQRAAPSHCAPD